jgi:hypothetical protein
MVWAADTGIHGVVSFKYELGDTCPGQAWLIDVHYNIFSWIGIGASETTFTSGYFKYFDSVPVYQPEGQLYEMYLVGYIGDNVEIKVSQWCLHPVYNNDVMGVVDGIQGQGLYIQGTYKF